MAVLDVPAPHGVITPVPSSDLRPTGSSRSERSSDGHPSEGSDAGSDQTVELADRLAVTERSLRAAQELVQMHVGAAGRGQAGPLVATLDGVRAFRLSAAGLMAAGRSETLSVGVAMLADPLVVLAVGGGLHWRLMPGGPSVTARADALRFIRGLAAGGSLTLQLGDHDPLPPLEFDGGPWSDEDEWRLFEDLAVLEEWSGVGIPMPAEVAASEATIAAQAASWARTQRLEATISGALTFEAAAGLADGDPDELRVHQEFGLDLLGITLPMGEGAARIALSEVQRETDDGTRFTAWPASPDVTFDLSPPPGRVQPARRTQARASAPPVREPDPGIRAPIEVRRPSSQRLSAVLRNRTRRLPPSGATAALLDAVRGD